MEHVAGVKRNLPFSRAFLYDYDEKRKKILEKKVRINFDHCPRKRMNRREWIHIIWVEVYECM